MEDSQANALEQDGECGKENSEDATDLVQRYKANRDRQLRSQAARRRVFVIAGGVAAVAVVAILVIRQFGASEVSGDWVVDWEQMMDVNTLMGVSSGDAAWQIASYMDMRTTFSRNTIRMTDGDGFHDCTATYRTIPFDSQEKLLDAVADYHEGFNQHYREEIRRTIDAGEMNLSVAEITANANNGEGLDIFKPGQRCIFYAPGPKKENRDEMTFAFNWFGDEVAALFLVRAGTPRGRELLRKLEEMEAP